MARAGRLSQAAIARSLATSSCTVAAGVGIARLSSHGAGCARHRARGRGTSAKVGCSRARPSAGRGAPCRARGARIASTSSWAARRTCCCSSRRNGALSPIAAQTRPSRTGEWRRSPCRSNGSCGDSIALREDLLCSEQKSKWHTATSNVCVGHGEHAPFCRLWSPRLKTPVGMDPSDETQISPSLSVGRICRYTGICSTFRISVRCLGSTFDIATR
mmetsp:Transcript_21440/g.46100  ORF Transcript_21440/g.46100 Transcript_21440/m.46100 type:complete len:217 (-) Transcript_21440:20-670(-)